LGSLCNLNFFFAKGQSNWHIGKKEVGLVRHAQLINMKHNKTMLLLLKTWIVNNSHLTTLITPNFTLKFGFIFRCKLNW
jgi:hypothetical protein